ncbi:EF-hand calcium-binding domain-containing protein 14 isoform X1 [Cricetulus griseus]|uniref:EF-hand calcium-binding domain-containing protein 14 isoform X1 n=1 Tax=Cricetulus griseus TaxID=10029 RepID=A0A9J7GPA9_CRIGR|nr:EF-hand calcium-binding domain-containing protein 14 isoform X1 [Cricetulus griseus]XP_035295594.1 EF-hand calcium-binding domain-containing protein 14 isoform X1 [Cricetulus griseus]XP_035296433.1 EF-hand calcium-binding domain-containing protein 14 isoform X1 [Cricetulus griseus]XP_035296440.1 EF-hand calcium-binding domain-containing protein 14 isoform X1 [Cricetulus griseus]
MKKRKELNALIGLAGDSRRKKPKKGPSSHRLLRTEPPDSDSESSSEEEEEFGAIGNRSRFVKGDYLRCCKICYPLCAFVILAACVVACVGLVWMQVALKEDLDALKEKFRAMESNQKSSFQEIPKLNEELLSKQKQLEKIESGELGLSRVWINITEMNKQISLLSSAVNHLKANVKSAADLLGLPSTVEGLQKSVASIGNTLNSVHLAVEAIQRTVDEHKKTLELLQSNMEINGSNKELDNKTNSESSKQDILYLHNSLEEINSTVVGYQRQSNLKFEGMNETLSNLTQRLSLMESDVAALNKAEKRANLTSSRKEDNSNSQVSKLREKLQLISALTNKPESNRPPETAEEEQVQNFTSDPSTLPKFSYFLGNQMETQLKPISLPGISSIKGRRVIVSTLLKRISRADPLGAGAAGTCEPHNKDAGELNSVHSSPLSHLSKPLLDFLFVGWLACVCLNFCGGCLFVCLF